MTNPEPTGGSKFRRKPEPPSNSLLRRDHAKRVELKLRIAEEDKKTMQAEIDSLRSQLSKNPGEFAGEGERVRRCPDCYGHLTEWVDHDGHMLCSFCGRHFPPTAPKPAELPAWQGPWVDVDALATEIDEYAFEHRNSTASQRRGIAEIIWRKLQGTAPKPARLDWQGTLLEISQAIRAATWGELSVCKRVKLRDAIADLVRKLQRHNPTCQSGDNLREIDSAAPKPAAGGEPPFDLDKICLNLNSHYIGTLRRGVADLVEKATAANQRADEAEKNARNWCEAAAVVGMRLTDAERLLEDARHLLRKCLVYIEWGPLIGDINAFLQGERRDEVPVPTGSTDCARARAQEAGGNDQPEVPDSRSAASHRGGPVEHVERQRQEPEQASGVSQAVANPPAERTADECLDYLHHLAGDGYDDQSPYDEARDIIRAELAALRKRVAEGEKDTQRIDWMERHKTDLWYDKDDREWSVERVVWNVGYCTARDAIDYAIEVTSKNPSAWLQD